MKPELNSMEPQNNQGIFFPEAKLATLKTYVASINECSELIEVADSNHQEIRALRDQLNAAQPLTSSEILDPEVAKIVIVSIYTCFEQYWRHVNDDLQQIDNYVDRLELDQPRHEILNTISNLRDELDKLEVIEEMHTQIQEPGAQESSDIMNASKAQLKELGVSLEKIDKSASEIRLALFRVLRLQVDRLSDEFYDSVFGG